MITFTYDVAHTRAEIETSVRSESWLYTEGRSHMSAIVGWRGDVEGNELQNM